MSVLHGARRFRVRLLLYIKCVRRPRLHGTRVLREYLRLHSMSQLRVRHLPIYAVQDCFRFGLEVDRLHVSRVGGRQARLTNVVRQGNRRATYLPISSFVKQGGYVRLSLLLGEGQDRLVRITLRHMKEVGDLYVGPNVRHYVVTHYHHFRRDVRDERRVRTTTLCTHFVLNVHLARRRRRNTNIFMTACGYVLLLTRTCRIRRLHAVLSRLFRLGRPEPCFDCRQAVLVSQHGRSVDNGSCLPTFLDCLPVNVFVCLIFLLVNFRRNERDELGNGKLFAARTVSVLSQIKVVDDRSFRVFNVG